jgi:hypothetical protein
MTGQSRKPCKLISALSREWQQLINSRKAAKLAHPDVGGSEEKMQNLNEAYEVLTTPGTSHLN